MVEYITDDGKEMLSQMMSGNIKINFTKIQMGDGYLKVGQSKRSMTELVNLVKEVEIYRVNISNENVISIMGIFENTDITSGFFFREKGIYASDGNNEILFAYANDGDGAEYINPPTIESIEKQIISLITIFQDTETEIKINVYSGIYALYEDLENLETELVNQIKELNTVSSTTKAGLMPKLSGDESQFINGLGGWSSFGKYQQKITKTTAKTPFELTQSNVDWSRTNFDYYGGDSSNQPSLTVYLASGVTFDPNTQYITSCTAPIFSSVKYDTLESNSTGSDWDYPNTYGGFYLYLFSNDGTEITHWDSDSGKSSNIATTYESAQDLLSYIEGYYFVKNSSSTYIASALSEITGDYLIGNTDVLIPYASGYLYEDSEGGYIDFLLSCANNNNALSTRMYKFGVATNPYDSIGQNISLKENTKYKFSTCVKVVSGTVTYIGFVLSDTTGTKFASSVELPITNGKVSYEFTTGSDLTNFKRCYVYNGKTNQTTSRQVLLYNMMIKEI